MLNKICKILLRSLWGEDANVKKFRKRMSFLEFFFFGKVFGVSICNKKYKDVSAHIIKPRGCDSSKALLYFHGGGFVSHSPKIYQRFCSRLAKELKCVVIVPDYRLAPEHPFPAALEDCVTVYQEILKKNTGANFRLCIAGDSAGGNLALATMLKIKETGLKHPCALWLISPAVDCDWSKYDYSDLQKSDPMFTENAFPLMDAYFGDEDKSNYMISPLNGDLRNLPPILVEAGGDEIFRRHPILLENALKSCGGDVIVKIWPRMMHVFQLFTFLPEAKKSISQACQFLENKMNPSETSKN